MEKGMTIDRMEVGQIHESSFTITGEMIEGFAEATGDYNPLHVNEEYARGTIFKTRVAHGMLQAGILSGVLGTRFPGVGTIYLSQSLTFLKPVFIGDRITFRLRVVELLREKNRARLETVCINQRGEIILTGEALVMPPS
jgi:3-hydroxybutyryl-CoA dehydratase